jgi:hypothetical protein
MLETLIAVIGIVLMIVCGAGMMIGTSLVLLDDGTVSTSDVLAGAALMWGVFGPPIVLGFHLTFTRWLRDARIDRVIAVLTVLSVLLAITVVLLSEASSSFARGFIAIVVVSGGSCALLVLALPSRPKPS